MGERKVLVNYISPDFDPALLSRGKKKKAENPLVDIRGMVPFTIQCTTCREYTFKGKKFNGKKEIAVGHEYKGIRVFRLYLKCTACGSAITIRTDPETSGYTVESGACRQSNIYDDKTAEDALEKVAKEEEEKDLDAMQKLERKTVNNQTEIEDMEALEELQQLNRRNERMGVNHALQALQEGGEVQVSDVLKRLKEDHSRRGWGIIGHTVIHCKALVLLYRPSYFQHHPIPITH